MTRSQKDAVARVKELIEDYLHRRSMFQELKEFSVQVDKNGMMYITIIIGLPQDNGFEFTRGRCDLIVGKRGKTTYFRRHHFHADQTVEVPFEYSWFGLKNAFGANLRLRVLEGMNND